MLRRYRQPLPHYQLRWLQNWLLLLLKLRRWLQNWLLKLRLMLR